jgi:hypothetical protein
VGPLNIALWVGGIVLMAVGYTRARTPYARYRELGANEASGQPSPWSGSCSSSRASPSVKPGCAAADARAPCSDP